MNYAGRILIELIIKIRYLHASSGSFIMSLYAVATENRPTYKLLKSKDYWPVQSVATALCPHHQRYKIKVLTGRPKEIKEM